MRTFLSERVWRCDRAAADVVTGLERPWRAGVSILWVEEWSPAGDDGWR